MSGAAAVRASRVGAALSRCADVALSGGCWSRHHHRRGRPPRRWCGLCQEQSMAGLCMRMRARLGLGVGVYHSPRHGRTLLRQCSSMLL